MRGDLIHQVMASPPPSPDSEPALTLHTAAQAAGSGAFLSKLEKSLFIAQEFCCVMLSFQQKTDAVFIRATILPFVLKIDHFKLQNLVPPRRL